MTKVSTAASVPPILHMSTARALQTGAGRRSSRKTRRRHSPSFEARMLRASRCPSSCEKVGKRRGTIASSFSPFQAPWPPEKSKFMNSVRSLSTSKACTLRSAHKPLQSWNSRTDVAKTSDVLRVTEFVSNAPRRDSW